MPRPLQNPKAEQFPRLDVRQYAREHAHGLRDASSMVLEYAHGGHLLRQQIGLTRTPCHLGGSRVWFVCPCCWRRSAVLFLRSRRYACRKCHRLTYLTQQLGPLQRTWRKQSKLEALAGPDGAKPKGMHWSTWERLLERIEDCEERRAGMLWAWLGRETMHAHDACP